MIGYKTTQVLKALGWFCVAGVLCAVLLTGVLNPVLSWLASWERKGGFVPLEA